MSDFLPPLIFLVVFVAVIGPVIVWTARRKGAPTRDATPPANPVTAPRPGVRGAVFDAREGLYTGERVTMTPEQKKARQRRSQWMALALIAFVILVFMITMTKMGAQIMVRDL